MYEKLYSYVVRRLLSSELVGGGAWVSKDRSDCASIVATERLRGVVPPRMSFIVAYIR